MSGSHREERHVWTSEMPNLQSTARRRRTAAAAHEGSRSERRAALRRPLSTLWCVCSFRRCDGERNGVQRVGLPRARTSAKRSAPRPDRAPESARLAGRPRLSTVDDGRIDPAGPTSSPEHALSIMSPKLKAHVGLRQVSYQVSERGSAPSRTWRPPSVRLSGTR